MNSSDIETEAYRWLMRQDAAELTPEERTDFEQWVGQHPRHRAAYLRVQHKWHRMNILRRIRPLDGNVNPDLLKGFRSGNGLSTPETPRRRRRPRPWKGLSIAAAAVAIAGLCVTPLAWVGLDSPPWVTYSTHTGGFERVSLSEGSMLQLNTDTTLRVRFTELKREVRLERGEAMFDVAHDERRPFDVLAGDIMVRAVGTSFTVRLRLDGQVDVLVREGLVAIDPPDHILENGATLARFARTLSENSTAIVRGNDVQLSKLQPRDMVRKLSWTTGTLVFNGEPLWQAVEEFNRYNYRKLVIADPAIFDVQIGGTFQSTDIPSFVAGLEEWFDIRAVPADAAEQQRADVIQLVREAPSAQP